MKKLITILFLGAVLISACKKEEGFSNYLRIKNSLSTLSFDCKVGNVDFGTINPGTTTDYKKVAEGESQLTGNLTGSITLPDKLTADHRFTLSLEADTTLTLTEDNN
jgi:hypothetical protein